MTKRHFSGLGSFANAPVKGSGVACLGDRPGTLGLADTVDKAGEPRKRRTRRVRVRNRFSIVDLIRRVVIRISAVFLIFVSLFYYLTTVDLSAWSGVVETALRKATGLMVRIDGKIGVSGPLIRPGLYAEQIGMFRQPQNWADRDERVAEIGRLDVHLNIWPLLTGNGYSEFSETIMTDAVFYAATPHAGLSQVALMSGTLNDRVNQSRPYFGEIDIRKFVLKNSAVEFRSDDDRPEGQTYEVEDLAIVSRGEILEIEWVGRRADQSFEFKADISPTDALLNGGSLSIDAVGRIGHSDLVAAIDVRDLESFSGSGSLQLFAPDLKDAMVPLGVGRPPENRPVSVVVDLTGDVETGFAGSTRGTVGAGDFQGTLSLHWLGRAHFEAYLESERFDLEPFGIMSAVQDAGAGHDIKWSPVSTTRSPLEGVFSFRVKELLHDNVALGSADLMLTVSRGLVDAALVRRHPTDGLIAASLLYDRANAGYFNLSANMQQLDLGEVSVVLAPDYPISAHLDLGAQFQSNGFTIDDLRRNLSGQLDVLMGPGRVGKWILDAALFEDEAFIGEPPGASGDLELNCFVGRVVLTNGLGKLTTFMLDTSTTVLTGFGGIALENGQFDVELMRRPKDPLNLDAVRDVRVTGSLSNLVISDTNAEVQRGLSGGIAGLVLGDEPSAGLPLISDQLTGETPCVGPSFDS